ncbi:hypothetical protein JTB14_036066 [Gonioctena quinquepunctata]|nr:hypothetical protein JTB14_036066 [Gonioctena quinquepunctata]
MLKRLLGERVEYETALATVLRDSKHHRGYARRGRAVPPRAEAKKQHSEGTGPISFSAMLEASGTTPNGHHGSGRENPRSRQTNQVPGLHTLARVAGSNLRRSGESRLPQGDSGNTRTLERGDSPDRRRGRNAKTSRLRGIHSGVRGKRTSPGSVLNREASQPGTTDARVEDPTLRKVRTRTFSLEEASVKALEKLDFKPYFSFGRVQFRLKA